MNGSFATSYNFLKRIPLDPEVVNFDISNFNYLTSHNSKFKILGYNDLRIRKLRYDHCKSPLFIWNNFCMKFKFKLLCTVLFLVVFLCLFVLF